LHGMDGPSRFDGHPLGHFIGFSHLHAQSKLSTFQHSWLTIALVPDGFHMQAITDSVKSVYSFLRETPTVQYILHNKVQKWSATRLFAAVTALPLRSLPSSRHIAISPLRRAFHTTTPSSSPHRHALCSTRAPHSLLLWACAAHPPLFFPPLLPLSFRPRAASAPFFAPPPSLIRTPGAVGRHYRAVGGSGGHCR